MKSLPFIARCWFRLHCRVNKLAWRWSGSPYEIDGTTIKREQAFWWRVNDWIADRWIPTYQAASEKRRRAAEESE